MSHTTMFLLYSSCYKCAFRTFDGYQKYFIHSSGRSWRADKFQNVPPLRKFDRKKLETSSQSPTLEPISRTQSKDASERFKYSKEHTKQFDKNPSSLSSESVLYSSSTAASYNSPHDGRRDFKRKIQSQPEGRSPQLSRELKPFLRRRTTSSNFSEEAEPVRSIRSETKRTSSNADDTSSCQTSGDSSALFTEIDFSSKNTRTRDVGTPLRSCPSKPRDSVVGREISYDFLDEENDFELGELPRKQSLGGGSRSSDSEASRDSRQTRTEPVEMSSRHTSYDFLLEDDIELPSIETSAQSSSRAGNELVSRNIPGEEIDDRIEQSGTSFQSLTSEPMLSSKSAMACNRLPKFAKIEGVLNYLANNADIDVTLYASIFETIDALLKRGVLTLSPLEICKRREIENLSRNVQKNLSSLEIQDAVVILKVLTNLGISMNSTLCYDLLNMLLKSIHKLELKSLLILDRTIASHSHGVSNSLLNAFTLAVPVVFEAQVRNVVDECDAWTLVRAATFAVSHDTISTETREMLVAKLTKRIDELSAVHTYTVMKLLPKAGKHLLHLQPLYRKLISRMEAGLEELSNEMIVDIICGSIYKCLRICDEEFFNDDFFKRAISRLIRNEPTLSLNGADKLLYKLNYVNYYCPELLDYMDEQFKKTPAFTANEVSCYVHACSNNMHKPPHWNSYKERMLASVDSLKIVTQLGLVMDLLILQSCPLQLVAHCFDGTFLRQLPRTGLLMDRVILRLQRIQELVKVLYTLDYSGPFLPDHLVERALTLQCEQKSHSLMNNALVQGLGGQEYVLRGVKTEFGQVIQHLVVKSKSGKLCAVNPWKNSDNCKLSYESLKLPADSRSIAIASLGPGEFCNLGTSRLTGRTQLRFRCLEARGIAPILIPYVQWLNLPADERISYLVNKVDSTFSQRTNSRIFDQRS